MKETNYYVIKKESSSRSVVRGVRGPETVRFKESSFCIRSYREGGNQSKFLL